MITSDHPNNLELSEPINLLSFDVSHNKKFELDLYPTTLTEKMFQNYNKYNDSQPE